MLDLDQAHQVLGAVGAVNSQPDQGVPHLRMGRQDMDRLNAGSGPQLADERVALIGQIVEPGEREIAEIGENQAPRRDRLQQRAGADLVILVGQFADLHLPEALALDIERGQ